MDAADLAQQLEPLLGSWAKSFFACGLLAAGLTSAITAPLAAAYAVSGAMGWRADLQSWRFRLVWLSVLLSGLGFAVADVRPEDGRLEFEHSSHHYVLFGLRFHL